MSHEHDDTLRRSAALLRRLRLVAPSFQSGVPGSNKLAGWPVHPSLANFLRREWTSRDVPIATISLHPVWCVDDFGSSIASRIGFIPIGRCADGDSIALDFTAPHLPTYVVEMTNLVSSFRTADDRFAIRLADSLPDFLEGLIDGSFWPHAEWFDYYVAEGLVGDRFPEPESRPLVSSGLWEGL